MYYVEYECNPMKKPENQKKEAFSVRFHPGMKAEVNNLAGMVKIAPADIIRICVENALPVLKKKMEEFQTDLKSNSASGNLRTEKGASQNSAAVAGAAKLAAAGGSKGSAKPGGPHS